jgi:hypothetical protein
LKAGAGHRVLRSWLKTEKPSGRIRRAMPKVPKIEKIEKTLFTGAQHQFSPSIFSVRREPCTLHI